MQCGTKSRGLLPVLLLLHCFCVNVTGQTYRNYADLVTAVTTGYNSDIIPLDDHSQQMTVTVSGRLYSLVEVDVVLGKVKAMMSVTTSWTDTQITWTPATYGNLASIIIPKSTVWSPALVLGTPLDFTTLGKSWMPVNYWSNGSATITDGDVVESACTFNLKFWPFDKHTCDISFIVYGYDNTQLQLQLASGGDFSFNSGALDDNIEWVISDLSAFTRTDAGLSEVVFRIELERRSGIFIILIVFPLYALACLNSFVFIIPMDSGERIGFATTLMLAITVFLETISDYVPNSSKPIPLLCIMVTVGITMSITCTLLTIIGMYFYFKSDDVPVHRYLIRACRLFNKKYREPKVGDGSVISVRESFKGSAGEDGGLALPKKGVDGESSPSGDAEISWKHVSDTFDKVCFISLMMCHTTMTIIFTFYLALGTN